MNRIKKTLGLLLTSLILATGLVATSPPVEAKADSYITTLAAGSTRTIRVYRENNCVGYKNQLLRPTHRNADYKVASIYIKPHRVVLLNWYLRIETEDRGRCYNIPAVGMWTLAIKVTVNYS